MGKAVKTAVKKTATKKSPPAKSEVKSIKYADKSGGQPQLVPVYNELRQILLQQVKGNMKLMDDKPGQVHLISKKPTEILEKKRDALYFASLLVQKGYVGFYLMPVYSDEFLKKQIAPELLKCLKGKSCFHIKKLDDKLKSQVAQALQAGYDCYEKKGWV
jgi:hypothetical protein